MWKLWLSLCARLLLGCIWLYAGIPKVMHYEETIDAINQYGIVSREFSPWLAVLQPMVEIIIGLFLIVGIGVRWCAGISIIMLVTYIAGIVSLGVRGKKVDCGCFNIGGYNPHAGWATYSVDIARDMGFIVLAVIVLFYLSPWADIIAIVSGKKPQHEDYMHTQELDDKLDLAKLGLDRVIVLGKSGKPR